MTQTPAVWFYLRNPSHLRIVRGAAQALEARGIPVRFAHQHNHRQAPALCKALAAQQVIPVNLKGMLDQAQPGDCIALFSPIGQLAKDDLWQQLHGNGVRLAQIVEGGRLREPDALFPHIPSWVLAWGPSYRGYDIPNLRIVGSPLVEAAAARGRVPPKPGAPLSALINYKFTFGHADADLDLSWADLALGSAADAGLCPVVSVHPRTGYWPLTPHRSDRPVSDLLTEAGVFVSRASSVLYEALAAGVPVLFVPANGDQLFEYAAPLGAFPTVRTRDDAAAHLRGLATGHWPFDPAAYLARHVSFDPGRSADLRMADALADILAGPLLPIPGPIPRKTMARWPQWLTRPLGRWGRAR